MCKHCKKQSREFTIELVTIHGSNHNRTGCDLNDHDPRFTYCGEPLTFERYAVNLHWMTGSLHAGAVNKMLYHLCSDLHTELFGAVYDSIAYLYVVKLDNAACERNASEPESLVLEEGTYYLARNGQTRGPVFKMEGITFAESGGNADEWWEDGTYAGPYESEEESPRDLVSRIPNPEPERKYRMLEVGELLEDGDEFHNVGGGWIPITRLKRSRRRPLCYGEAMRYRRPITASDPVTSDPLTEAVAHLRSVLHIFEGYADDWEPDSEGTLVLKEAEQYLARQ